jgi:hypothetical protein
VSDNTLGPKKIPQVFRNVAPVGASGFDWGRQGRHLVKRMTCRGGLNDGDKPLSASGSVNRSRRYGRDAVPSRVRAGRRQRQCNKWKRHVEAQAF